MSRKARDRLTLLGFALVYGGAFAATAASQGAGPNGWGFGLKAVGWTVFVLFLGVNVFVLLRLRRR